MTHLLGAILVGGAGRRFGGPKDAAFLPGGDEFEGRVRRALLSATPDLVRIGGESRGGIPGLGDHRPGLGPLGGLETGLRAAQAQGAPGMVVLAVDLVRMSGPAVLELLYRWRALPDPRHSALIAEAPDGPQPLAAVYGVGLASVLSDWLDQELAGPHPRLAIRAWLSTLTETGLTVARISEAELDEAAGHRNTLLNVNRRDDLAAAAAPVAPPVIAIHGWKNSGKTTVAARLISELARRGLKVMALKRGHGFNLDQPGTDSSQMTGAGASRVLLAGPNSMALMGSWPAEGESSLTALAARHLSDADVVIAEGWKNERVPAIEVRRAGARDQTPLWRADGDDRDRFLALVSDPPASDQGFPSLSADDPDLAVDLADLVLSRVLAPSVSRRVDV